MGEPDLLEQMLSEKLASLIGRGLRTPEEFARQTARLVG